MPCLDNGPEKQQSRHNRLQNPERPLRRHSGATRMDTALLRPILGQRARPTVYSTFCAATPSAGIGEARRPDGGFRDQPYLLPSYLGFVQFLLLRLWQASCLLRMNLRCCPVAATLVVGLWPRTLRRMACAAKGASRGGFNPCWRLRGRAVPGCSPRFTEC